MHAIVGRRVFTASEGDEPLIDEGCVLYDDEGIIREVGPANYVLNKVKAEVREIDGLVVPGLIDVHTHLCLNASNDPGRDIQADHPAHIALRGAQNLSLHLDAGVTTIRDVGGVHGIDLELMRLVDRGVIEGPQVLAAGRVLCMTGGHACFMGVECDSPDDFRRAARAEIKAGAKLIKLIATGGVITPGVAPGAQQLTENEMRAACEVAHRASRRVAAHAQGAEGIDAALRAGVDTIEHGFWLSPFALEFMRKNDVTLVPTFAALHAMQRMRKDLPAFIADKLDAVSRPQAQSFKRARQAGVQFATGTDAGTPGNPHGDIVHELLALQEAGVAAADVFRAATAWAARSMGLEDRGVLTSGKRADIAVFPNAAFEDVRHADAPRLVVQGGRVVRGA